MNRFFVYGYDGQFDTLETAEEAQSEAEAHLDIYRDESPDGWSEDAGSICWGEIRQSAQIVSRERAPEGSEFDEIIDYGLKDVEPSDLLPEERIMRDFLAMCQPSLNPDIYCAVEDACRAIGAVRPGLRPDSLDRCLSALEGDR